MKAGKICLTVGFAFAASVVSATGDNLDEQFASIRAGKSLEQLRQSDKPVSSRMAVKDAVEGSSAPTEVPASPKSEPRVMQVKRWPVQILSAVYGTAGKDADVTDKVKEHVETYQRTFSANPRDLGADPNPGWNKGLRIVYMKDGVRREQRRNENETILPESFYGPQDAGEIRSWLPGSRWTGEKPEIQFHADQTFTSPRDLGINRWEVTGPKRLRLTWNGKPPMDFEFDYTWSSLSEVDNGKNVYHMLK